MPERALELEAKLECPKCAGVPYYLYRRQIVAGGPVWEHVLWAGQQGIVPPPADPAKIVCPQCGVELVRK